MITNAINSAIAFIAASRPCSKSEDMPTIIANQVGALQTIITNAPYALADVTSAMTVMHAAPFGDDHRADLVARIHAKTQSSAVDGESKHATGGQAHHFIFNYMTSTAWHTHADKARTELDRVIEMVSLCHKIGLYFPDVATRKIIVATMMLAQGTSPSPRGAKTLYDTFSTINNDRRPLKKYAPTTMQVFPEDMQSFIEVHQTTYAVDDRPVMSRLSKTAVHDLAASIPVRKTSKLLVNEPSAMNAPVCLPTISLPSMASSSNPMLHMQHMFMKSMQQMMGMHMNAHSGDAPDPDMQVTLLRKRNQLQLGNSSPPIDGAQPQPLALADGQASSPNDSAGGSMDTNDASTAAGIATPHRPSASFKPSSVSEVDADINRMLNGGSNIDTPPPKKQKVGTAVAAPVMKRPAAAHDAPSATFDRSSPPKFGTKCPCVFNNCRIYETPTKFRAVPAPDRSVYDKSFPFKAATKKAAWDTLIKYCRDPFIPKDSKNYVKIGKF